MRNPHLTVTAIAAISLDGKITKHQEEGTAFTSAEDKSWFAKTLGQFDCSICGNRTYAASKDFIRSRLSHERLRIVMTKNPGALSGEVVEEQLEFSSGPPEKILQYLESLGKRRCALLGGGHVYSAFFRDGLIDDLWLTLEPAVFGAGRPFTESIALDNRFEFVEFQTLNRNTILLHYRSI